MVELVGNISSVLGVVLQVGKWLAAPIGRRFMYLYNYNTNFDNLREEVNRLKDVKDRVERKVDAVERNMEEIEENVRKWQNNVEKTVVQTEGLIQDKRASLGSGAHEPSSPMFELDSVNKPSSSQVD
ncbi:hypothetical protein Pint_13708 [Pistacia integerrima]|uniref:Uncharacterized protein n=1 Tax=Pistacia integerrima TaxID=434235 RepID=A0ACC0Y4Y4_9ROSI|nr:hypothetical protein Pint_13708 [Pistacia integerrima]